MLCRCWSSDGTSQNCTYSAATTLRAIAAQTGNTVFPEDFGQARCQLRTLFRRCWRAVTIDRATPVTLNLYNSSQTARNNALKLLVIWWQRRKFSLAKKTMPLADTPLTPGQQIHVIRNGVTTTTVTEDIAMLSNVTTDTTLAHLAPALCAKPDHPAKKPLPTKLICNGVEVGRTAIQTVETQEPVTQIGARQPKRYKGDRPGRHCAMTTPTWIILSAKESNWNPNAQNASGAYGLCQHLPGSKMASAGSDWATNPVQLRWCNSWRS